MKPLQVLAEKYQQVINPSVESLIERASPQELLTCFAKHPHLYESSIALFSYVNSNRINDKSLVTEDFCKDEDIKLTILAVEKVLTYLYSSNDKDFAIAFESYLNDDNISKVIFESAIAEAGLLSKIGKGIGKAATAVGKGVGHVAHGLGAVAGGVRGALSAAKTGYEKGKGVVGSVGRPGTTTVPGTSAQPATQPPAAPAGQQPAPKAVPTQPGTQTVPAQTTPAQPVQPAAQPPVQPAAQPPVQPAAQPPAKVNVGQINKIVQTLRARDLESIKKNIDARLQQLAAKRGGSVPTAK